MGVPNQNTEGQTQPGRRPTFDSLLAQDDGKSRSAEGFVIRPIEIIRLLGYHRGHPRVFMQIGRAATKLGISMHQWSSRKGYLVHDAIQIFEIVAEKNNKRYKIHRLPWFEIEMLGAARDLGGDGITFSEAAKILGIPELTKQGDRSGAVFPFERHSKQPLYRPWLRQAIAHVDDVRKAYDGIS